MPDSSLWYDDEAGPVVRPYALTRGRTRPAGKWFFDLVARVHAVRPAPGPLPHGPEQRLLLDHCREPVTVADLSSATDLPLGVVRVLLGDLCSAGLVRATRPVPPAQLPTEDILREVLHGLHAL
ncbi:DUF742 domain-containing protein [Streptomyces fildesensis]|uniref:DUF742 domain-containing protein n=1 Tax=Streptomyces fildesensis TaxID=375757 RepID=A0ABW8C3B4_9ACTN